MKIQHAVAAGLLAMTPALTGCLVRTHSVLKTRLPAVVYNSTLDQLLKQADMRNAAIQSATIFVDVTACSGGSLKGDVKCNTIPFSGYIIIGKPEQIRLILNLPVIKSRAIDMVSDGKAFKMLIPPESCAITGSDVVTNSSQKGLYALRPAVILDSLLIPGLEPNQVISMTQDSWTPPQPKNRKGIVENPDYDIEFLSQPEGQVARALRVLHIDRTNLLPWRQDIYNSDGKVATQAFYSNYKKFGEVNFPTKIEIQRPLDELGLTITVTARTIFNQKFDADQFDLGPIPASYATYNMDDPTVAAIAPCVAHAPQSKH